MTKHTAHPVTPPDIVQSEVVRLADITPNKGQIPGVPKNPRLIRDEKYRKLLQSIKDDPEMLGLREILIYRHEGQNVIIGGNMRYRALKELGYEEAIVKFLPDGLSPEKLRAIVIKDNSGFGEWDFDLLANEWNPADLDDWAVDLPNVSEALEEGEAEEDTGFDVDEATLAEDEAISCTGDIYALGPHRLVCGDCTEGRTLDALFATIGGRQADLYLTDPPYNVDYNAKNDLLNQVGKGSCVQRDIKGDAMSEERFHEFIVSAFATASSHIKPGGAFYIWHAEGSYQGITFRLALRESGLEVKQVLVWIKNNFVLGRQDYQWIHEPCLYGWKPGASHYFRDVRSEITAFFAEHPDIDKMNKEELRQALKLIDGLPQTAIKEDKPRRSDLHPTMKPVKLMGRLIRNSSRPGDVVLDTFGGSGSTLIACEQLGRCCLMCELEPVYADVIVKRWEELTGQQARKIGNYLHTEGTD